MEQLQLNNGNGQSYGYIVYRKKLQLRNGSVLSMRGRPRDLLQVKLLDSYIDRSQWVEVPKKQPNLVVIVIGLKGIPGILEGMG